MKPLTQQHAPVGKQTRRRRIDAVLISSDDSFLIELGPLLGDGYRTHTVDSPLTLGALAHRPSWLAILDVAALADARAAVARMLQRYPQVPVIVVAPTITEWSAMVSRGAIVAAIGREQLDGAPLTEALAAAASRLTRDGLLPDGSTATHRIGDLGAAELAAALDAAEQAARPVGTRRFGSWSARPRAAAIVLGSAAVVAAVWWLWSSGGSKATLQRLGHSAAHVTVAPSRANNGTGLPGAAPGSAASRSQMILELLSAARVEFHDQKLLFPRPDTLPRGDSALELYAQVLSQDAGNGEALDGIRRLWSIAHARIQGDINSGNSEDAERLIGLFGIAGVQQQLLQPLSSSLGAARQLEQQLKGLSGQLQAAIAGGALLAPEHDNALARLEAMHKLSRNHPLTLDAQRRLRAALLAGAQQASDQKHFDTAQRYLTTAAGLPGAVEEITRARQQLQADVQATQRAARNAQGSPPGRPLAAPTAARPTAASGNLRGASGAAPAVPSTASTTPSTGVAAAAVAAGAPAASERTAVTPPAVAAADPSASLYLAAVPARPLNVRYPSNMQDIEGHVIIEFTLHPNGSASDLEVIESNPGGIFDGAAMTAVRRGRFQTGALVNQQPRRARISVRFKPQ